MNLVSLWRTFLRDLNFALRTLRRTDVEAGAGRRRAHHLVVSGLCTTTLTPKG